MPPSSLLSSPLYILLPHSVILHLFSIFLPLPLPLYIFLPSFLLSLSSINLHHEALLIPMERKSLAFFFLLFVLLASQEMVVPSEGRVCESQSHNFKGACMGDHNCALVCRNEGFSGGNCRGFRHRCFCTKLCT